MGSLRARLMVVWAASLAACAVMGVLLVQLYAQSASATAAGAALAGLRACDRLADRFAFYAAGWEGAAPGPLDAATRRELASVAQAATSFAGLSVGFWRDGEGVVAAAPLPPLPTEGAALDAAAAEAQTSGAVARQTAADGTLLVACPLGRQRDIVGWARLAVADTPALDRLQLGLGVLVALVAGISAWLTWLIAGWNRQVSLVEAALAGAAEALPRTGLRELDRLVAALDSARQRLATARERAAANERLAALGRVAAGVAHEIRNPVAAMRLGAENALASDPAGRGAALEAVLRQVARLDRLIAELLEMTQRRDPRRQAVELAGFLAQCAEAAGQGATVTSASGTAVLDPMMVGRILAILLDNATRHAPGAAVRIDAVAQGAVLRIGVEDDGPGIALSVRKNLFEPFITGRADGTGLGLAIARELAEAHGGTLRAVPHPEGSGARFELELPWSS